jgi:hypothetical protein
MSREGLPCLRYLSHRLSRHQRVLKCSTNHLFARERAVSVLGDTRRYQSGMSQITHPPRRMNQQGASY